MASELDRFAHDGRPDNDSYGRLMRKEGVTLPLGANEQPASSRGVWAERSGR